MKLTKRKDGRWQYNFSPEKGKKPKPFYSSLPDERKAEKEILKKISEFKESELKEYMFESVADKWNTEYRLQNSDINYRKCVRAAYNRCVEYFKDDIIGEIQIQDINLFLKGLASKKYSKKTIITHKNILNMIFSFAMLYRKVNFNPVRESKIPDNLPKTKRKIPETSELREVNKHCSGFDLLPFFILNTGCRKSEALAITDKSINFKTKRAKITHHVIHDDNKPIYEPVLKTESAEREIILPDKLIAEIPKNFKGFLFSMDGDGKEPLTKCAFDKRWKKYCKKHNLKITAHQLRHGYATMLHEAGIDVKDAQELMGHSDIRLTQQIYTHIRSERKEQTAKAINAFEF